MAEPSHERKVSPEWLLALLLLLAVILAYLPVWHAGFIWDDDDHVTANPCIVGPLGFKEIWTTSAAKICPLTLTTFWVEHALWGLQPLPYHLLNVLMHAACAIALWRVLRNLQIPGAWLGAVLWALHPIQVESVAWITETKNTQSGLFYLLSILFFVKGLKKRTGTKAAGYLKKGDWHEGRRVPVPFFGWNWNYALTLLFAALAMASKSSTVILPVVLCLCAWWVEGRWRWRNLTGMIPLFLMSLAAGVLSLWTQHLEGAVGLKWGEPTWLERLVMAGNAVWFYLGKLLWPHPLMTIYPHWEIDASQPLSYFPLLAVIIIPFFLWHRRESWSRPWFFAFAYFLVTLLPVLGLTDRYVADHYQYLGSMGPLALTGAGLARLADFTIPGRWRLQSILCAVLLLILGMASWQRAWVYRSNETLWPDTLAKNPNCWVGYDFLGLSFYHKGQVDEAIEEYQKALEIQPDDVVAHHNLGTAFVQKGQLNEAIAQYRKVLELCPDLTVVHTDLGNALLLAGHLDQAIAQYQKALEINPSNADSNYNLGLALVRKGRVDEAIALYQKILEMNPNDVFAHYHRANASLSKGDYAQALADFNQAIRYNPKYAPAYNNLAWLFATCPQPAFRNGEKAVEYATKACELSEWKDPHAVDTLAAACAEAGDFNNAVKWETQYLQTPDLDANDITDAKNRLALYQARHPYHANK